jgi:peptide/nickel transport system permease protein
MFAGLALVAVLDFLGMGTPPPTPTLGGILSNAFQMLRVRPDGALAPGLVLWACAFALYAASDALIGFFDSKEPLARTSE